MLKSDKITEQQNPVSMDIDTKSIREILKTINHEDQQVALAVERAIPQIEMFAGYVVSALQSGGRLFYLGSGTSGRLGVLDAAECPPTFSVSPHLVQGIIAGGPEALIRSIEGAEDQVKDGIKAVIDAGISNRDVVLGISSSSTTPFVLAGLKTAADTGAKTGLLICNHPPDNLQFDVVITVITGPEIITGSTRMKAGTATKMVLNMITTTAMIKLNKTYGNLMVDLKALNEKLWDRGARILQHFLDLDYHRSMGLLKSAEGRVKTAIVMGKLNLGLQDADSLLDRFSGSLRATLSYSEQQDD